MKKSLLAATALALLVALGFFAVVAIWLFATSRSHNKVLAIIASAQPGRSIASVAEKYGAPAFQTDDPERMGSGSAPILPEFIKGKKLHQYYVTPPCTCVNIYTDDSGKIVYVNWSSP